MAFGDPIDIEVTVSGESNTISSFGGGTTNVTSYSGGNNIEVTVNETTSSTIAQSGYNVDVIFSGDSTSVTGPFFLASTGSAFDCSDLDGCNLFKSGDVTGFGNILISGSGDYLIVSGASSSASIEIKNKGVTKTSAVSSMDFNQGYSVTNVGPAVTIDSNIGISNLTTAECTELYVTCEDRTSSGIYSGQHGDTLYLRGLIGTGTVTVTGYPGNDNFIYISGGGGSTQTAANIGYGSGVYSGTVGDEFKLRSISGVSGIAVTGHEDNTVVISGSYTGIGGTFITTNPNDPNPNPKPGIDKTPTPGRNVGGGHGIFSGISPTPEEGGYDPLYDKCVLLINPDEADGSSTVEDLSKSKHNITVAGALNKNTQKKFGNTSLLFDGTNDALTISDHSNFYMDDKDFAVEAWVYLNHTSHIGAIVCKWDNGGSGGYKKQFLLYYDYRSGGSFGFLVSSNGTSNTNTFSRTNPQAGEWYHVAGVRDGNKLKLFVNGILEASADFVGSSFNNSAVPLTIGCHRSSASNFNFFNGYIDGVRITKEASSWGNRYVGEFTPPVAPFPSSKHPPYSKIDNQKNLFKSISGVSGIQVVSDDQHVYISGGDGSSLTGASNIGTGSGIYSGTLDNDLKFKTLIAGPNIVLSGDNEHIMISGSAGGGGGTTQTAANIGFGSGIYSGTVSDEFKLRSISGAGSVTITGYEDNTIIVSGSEVAGGAVSWTLPPPLCPTGIGTTGQISFDDVYYYICIRENTWRRVAISEWSC